MDDETLTKRAFAALLYKQGSPRPFEAALQLFSDPGKALQVSNEWPRDPVVLAELVALGGADAEQANRIPTKEDLLRKIWGWLDKQGGLMTFDEKIKAAKLFAELQDFIPKPGSNNTTVVVPRVMLVNDNGDTLTWEQKLQQQQNALIEAGEREIVGDATTV